MFESNSDNRGQVGIGTLIVFIAMVLVAAIAAGVLINTAGLLQSQAEATGEESTDLVSERIDTTSAVGIVEDSPDDENPDELQEIRVGITAAPGASDIALSDTIVQVVGPNGQENLVYAGTGDGSFDYTDDDDGVDGVRDLEGQFVAEDANGLVEPSDAVIDDENDDFTLVFNPNNMPFGDGEDTNNFGEGDQSTLDIVSPSSATTQVDLTAPELFSNDGEAVRL